MSEDSNTRTREETPIKIDYDNVDVAAIMDQIKRAIAARPHPMFEEAPPSPHGPEGMVVPVAAGEGPSGFKARMKRILLRVMRPFAPLVKFLVFPVQQELRQTIVALDQTNRRLDYLFVTVEKELAKLSDAMSRRMDAEIPPLREDVVSLRDYAKLLHNLSHNLVVELTKLKIEEETLKNKVRIMEKDFEFLGRRERALEEEVLK
jgi:hypothetical protein